jgi:plastocyanin
MTRHRIRPLASVLALTCALGLGLGACGGGDDDDDAGGGSSTTSTASTTTEAAPSSSEPAGPVEGDAVTIANFDFGPNQLAVSPGTTVTWTNDDPTSHTATADDGQFDTGSLAPGDSGEFTFDEAGTFAYHCEIHPSMTASVVVE